MKIDNSMKIIGIISTVLTTLVLGPIWRGFVLSKLWLWLIAPTFGAPLLGIAQSIGLTLVVSFLTHQTDTYEDKTKTPGERVTSAVSITFLTPAMALAIGAIVRCYL